MYMRLSRIIKVNDKELCPGVGGLFANKCLFYRVEYRMLCQSYARQQNVYHNFLIFKT